MLSIFRPSIYLPIISIPILYYIWIIFFHKNNFVMEMGDIIFIFLSFIISFYSFIKTYFELNKSQDSGAYFWLLLAMGTVPFIGAWIIWAYDHLYLGTISPFPGPADFLWLFTYFLWICALLFQLTREVNKRELVRFLFDIIIFMIIITGFIWQEILSRIVLKLSGDFVSDFILLAYPVIDILTLFIVFLLYYSTRNSNNRVIYTFIALGFGFQTIADFIYLYESVRNITLFGSWIDPFWSISLLINGSAGIITIDLKKSQQATTRLPEDVRHYDFASFGLLLLFLGHIIYRNIDKISTLDYIFFVVYFLVIIKYFVIQFQKEKVLEKLHRLSKNLEKTVEDKTRELQLALNKMNKMAYTDNLTGLPNRYMLYQELEKSILEAGKNKKRIAIMFLDLDGFKFVNDRMGHMAGDLLLQEVAKRLRKSVRKQDLVARLGGDEFTILLKHYHQEQVTIVAERIINSFSNPFIIDGKVLNITTSIGISLFPLDSESGVELIKKADKAMYFAKEHGKNNFQFFSSVHERINYKLNIKNKLDSAIENNEMTLYYQPKYHLKTNQIIGFEALLRWENPELGKVPPDEFIPIAEETGAIIHIGKWVLRTVCSQLQKIANQYEFNCSIAINVSPVQFNDHFLQNLKQIIQETGIHPTSLYIEITENEMLDIKESKEILKELKHLGVKISIDDFGTGFSSMHTIASLSIDEIKIDRLFINDMMNNHKTQLLVKTIIKMGENLNTVIVAEGVETKEQVHLLKELNCDIAQGYYYGPPVPLEEIEKFLK